MAARRGRERDKKSGAIDGRTARAVRTRAAILDALLDLIEEGTPLPTALEVAERAAVALRSIRQHFESKESLFLAASARHAERMASRGDPAPPRTGPLDERILRFVSARARELEASSALRRSAMLRETSSAALTSALRTPARDRRREVERVFDAELAVVGANERTALLDAMDVVTGGKAWDALRRDLGRSRAEAERAIATALTALTRGV